MKMVLQSQLTWPLSCELWLPLCGGGWCIAWCRDALNSGVVHSPILWKAEDGEIFHGRRERRRERVNNDHVRGRARRLDFKTRACIAQSVDRKRHLPVVAFGRYGLQLSW